MIPVQNRRGQSTLEFALAIILILGFSFLFLKVSLLYAYGNYVHYATFMSARALLSSSDSKADQEERAKTVLIETLRRGVNNSGTERWPFMGTGYSRQKTATDVEGAEIGEGNQFRSGDTAFSWQVGVRYRFRSKLFIIPLGINPRDNVIELTSESWLGRDVSDEECRDYLSETIGGKVEIDNGC